MSKIGTYIYISQGLNNFKNKLVNLQKLGSLKNSQLNMMNNLPLSRIKTFEH